MKLLLLFMIVGLMHVSAASRAQTITLHADKLSLAEVIKAIRQQTDFEVFADAAALQHTAPVTVHAKEMSVEDFLALILRDQPLEAKVEEKTIMLSRKSGPRSSSFPEHLILAFPEVRGKIVDSLGNPLVGASIRVLNAEGRRIALQTTTDNHGEFVLRNVPEDARLEITFIGYVSQELPVKADTGTITLTIIHSELSEVDVVYNKGYYTESRRLSTGSVGRVSGETINKQPVANPLAALQGRISGLEITQTSGRTGANFNVMIRGRSSIDNGNEPLYIVDGVPWLSNSLMQLTGSSVSPQSPFNSLNPADISSMEVLKDADATAIYGSRGANGVILITTNKGHVGKTQVDVNVYSGFSQVGHTMPLMNTEQYLAMRREALANDGTSPTNTNAPDLLLYDQERYTDWKDLLIGNTAKMSNAQVTLSGGTANTQFRLAGGYHYETNVYPGDEANNRGSGQLNILHRSDDHRFLANATLNYSNDNNTLLVNDLMSNIYTAPNLLLYEEDGSIAWSENGSAIRYNPLGGLLQTRSSVTDNLISNLNASYRLFENLSATLNAGYTNTALNENQIRPLVSYQPTAARISGDSQFGNTRFKSWILEPQLQYQKQLNQHKIDVILGASWQEETLTGRRIEASNYSSEALLGTTVGATRLVTNELYSLYKYNAVFGRINYNYQNKYLLNLTGRRDGSSRFGPGRQFANFAAIGAAWIFSDEKFVQEHLKAISFGKIRGSYGLTGNDKIGNYQFMDTYGSSTYTYQDVSGIQPQRLYNPNYGWESNRKLEFALDLGFIHDRILLSSGWFRNRSGNQLLQYTLPSQTGFPGITRNLPALVENSGWELEVNSRNIQNKHFSWNTSFNLTIARNKLLDFPDLETSSYYSTYEIGKSLNIQKLYRYTGVAPETGLFAVDLDGGRTVIRDFTSNFYGGLNNTFNYKGFQLDVFFQFVNKDDWNYYRSLSAQPGFTNSNMPLAVLERWTEIGQGADIQRLGASSATATPRSNYRLSEGAVTDASFIRLKNVALSHQLPQRWINALQAKLIRIYFQGQNLFTITGYEGNDPEVTTMGTLPPLRTLTFGAQLTF